MKKHRKKQKKRVHMECHIFYYHVISVTNMIIAIYFGNLEKARSNMMGKPDISKVIPALARQALLLAGGDRKAAYSRYIQLYFRQTGKLAPGCDNKDLQAFYEKEGK